VFYSCHRCGRIHEERFKCTHNKPKYDNNKYKTTADKLRFNNKWKKKRKEIRESAKGLCEVCADSGAYVYKDLAVHHITEIHKAPERYLDNYNLISLCRYHHALADEGKITKEYLEGLARRREDG